MNNANKHDERIAKMTFASVYPMYLTKVEQKGRKKEELHQVIEWLTGLHPCHKLILLWLSLSENGLYDFHSVTFSLK